MTCCETEKTRKHNTIKLELDVYDCKPHNSYGKES